MRNKIIIILLGITLVVLTLILLLYLRYKASVNNIATTTQVQATPTTAEDLAVWTDQSGFSFQYSKSLKLDPHDEDKENYAHVELTNSTHPGRLIVWAKDTTASDINSWVKQTKSEGFIDTTLGDEPAKKMLTSGETRKLITTTIYNGYLYQVEVYLTDSDFWNKVYDSVFLSFKFIPLAESTSDESKSQNNATQDTGEEAGSGEEEVIE